MVREAEGPEEAGEAEVEVADSGEEEGDVVSKWKDGKKMRMILSYVRRRAIT